MIIVLEMVSIGIGFTIERYYASYSFGFIVLLHDFPIAQKVSYVSDLVQRGKQNTYVSHRYHFRLASFVLISSPKLTVMGILFSLKCLFKRTLYSS